MNISNMWCTMYALFFVSFSCYFKMYVSVLVDNKDYWYSMNVLSSLNTLCYTIHSKSKTFRYSTSRNYLVSVSVLDPHGQHNFAWQRLSIAKFLYLFCILRQFFPLHYCRPQHCCTVSKEVFQAYVYHKVCYAQIVNRDGCREKQQTAAKFVMCCGRLTRKLWRVKCINLRQCLCCHLSFTTELQVFTV